MIFDNHGGGGLWGNQCAKKCGDNKGDFCGSSWTMQVSGIIVGSLRRCSMHELAVNLRVGQVALLPVIEHSLREMVLPVPSLKAISWGNFRARTALLCWYGTGMIRLTVVPAPLCIILSVQAKIVEEEVQKIWETLSATPFFKQGAESSS